MEALWFALCALVAALYVAFDGFDLGAGALHRFVAKSDGERRQVLSAIGPFWDGNEVWLLVFGGTLFLAFPQVLAVGLSGFYLAIFLVAWTLIGRGLSIELRSHLGDPMWRGFWDTAFVLTSALTPVLFGAALGNLLRGVPIDEDGWFALSFFESFSPTGELGLLDWYTVLAGVFALAAVAHHGALFLAWKTDGAVRERSVRWAARLLPALVALWLAATIATNVIAPGVFEGLRARPLAWMTSVVAFGGLALSVFARRSGADRTAFLGSFAFLLGMLAATAASVYPTMIRALPDDAGSLTAHNAAASGGALTAALWWWPVGAALVAVYYTVLFRYHRGRRTAD